MDIDDLVLSENYNDRISSIESPVYLVGDLGATNFRLAAAAMQNGKPKILAKVDYDTAKIDGEITGGLSIIDIIEDFGRRAKNHGISEFKAAVLAPAGPVLDNGQSCRISQRDNIEVKIRDLYSYGISKAMIINDFGAIGYALPYIDYKNTQEAACLQKGTDPENIEVIGCIGPGTGLGAVSTQSEKYPDELVAEKSMVCLSEIFGRLYQYFPNFLQKRIKKSIQKELNKKKLVLPRPCEGGHIPASVSNHGIEQLINNLITDYRTDELDEKVISLEYEDFVSARGIGNISRAYKEIIKTNIFRTLFNKVPLREWKNMLEEIWNLKRDYRQNKEEYEKLFGIIDEKVRNNEITQIGSEIGEYNRGDLLLVDRTLDLFFEMYGRAARDAIMAQGPDLMLLAGGIAGKYIGSDEKGEQKAHHEHYVGLFQKGLMKNPVSRNNYTKNIPIYQIINPDIGLIGCTLAAHELAGYD
ncbi:hypothetical protein GF327_02695 [Candidatus Woesearchaeota archaeon]|nr:hypothetical protein [Candidatus Woesearchaeota archaeon]